jgi:energy-coupling factor transporter transmembrane protein EcfT
MVEKTAEEDRFSWRLPPYAALGALIVFVPVAIWTSEAIFYILVVAPIISLLLGIFLLKAAIAKKPRRCLSMLSMLAIYWVISAALLVNYSAVRSAARWFLWSHRYKAEVLAQPDSANGEFKHIEWDGWGFPGAGDTWVYLVFDPTDSLAAAAKNPQPGKFSGIPCRVPLVSRLESRWYAVVFYTDEYWGKRNRDCGLKD